MDDPPHDDERDDVKLDDERTPDGGTETSTGRGVDDGDGGERDDPPDDRTMLQVSHALRRGGTNDSLFSRLRGAGLWFLVDANRWLVVAVLTTSMFVSLFGIVVLSPVSIRDYLLAGTLTSKGYVELQTITVTVITIVLSINQLVLSPELGALSDQRSRLEDVIDTRTRAEELAEAPTTPTDPDHYLLTLIAATEAKARRLGEAVTDSDPTLRQRVDRYVADVDRETERVHDALEGRRFGTIELLGAAMHFTTADDIHAVRRMHNEYAESLSGAEERAFSDMLDALKLYTVAREYFRSLYVQWEFINFSRAILYTGLPALLVAHLTIGFVDANAFQGTLFGVPTLLWYETAAFTIATVPVIVVISYAARLSLLAKTGIFISPFNPESKGRHWEE